MSVDIVVSPTLQGENNGCMISFVMPKACKSKETATKPEPSAMTKNAISKAKKKLATGRWSRMSQNRYCYWACWDIQFSGRLKKPLLLSPGPYGQPIPVFNATLSGLGQSTMFFWETTPAFSWPSATDTQPTCCHAGLAVEIYIGSASLNRAVGIFTNALLS